MLARNRITGAAAEVLNPLLLGKRRPPAGYDDEAGTTEKPVPTHAFDAAAAVAGGESLNELQEGGLEGEQATAEGGKAAKRKKSKLGASSAAAREVPMHLATTLLSSREGHSCPEFLFLTF